MKATEKQVKRYIDFQYKWPVGSLISFVGGIQFQNAEVREFLRIDNYMWDKSNHLAIYGILCSFDFDTNKYKKEYEPNNMSKWSCMKCYDDFRIYVGTLCHKFNDVRLANAEEISIFNHCLAKM